MPPCDVLLLAAFAPELAPLAGVLGDAMRARIGGRDVAARAVGIGLPAAAVGASMLLAEMRPRAVVLLGTCGVYDAAADPASAPDGAPRLAVAIGQVIAARRVRLVEPAAALGWAEFPDPMVLVTEADASIVDGLARAGARPADVATTLAVTVDDGAAARVARATGAHVEHLEAHGVAAACAAHGVAFGAALGVANVVGRRAREEWRQHHRAASAAAAQLAVRWLRQAT